MADPKDFPTLASQHVFEVAGGYPVMRIVGEGGMGRVYACRDQALNRVVAAKVMLPERAKDPEMVQRFLREARAMAKVNSPHVVSIFHVYDGSEGEPPCIVMELLDGEDLQSRLERTGKVPVARTLDYMRDAAQGLSAASEAGLVHRDVKPANLVVVDGRLIITDFGLAKPVDGSADLTQKGLLAGSPHFMPPERARGEDEDFRADIYSLGATWYTLLAGKVPFDKATPVDTITAHLVEEAPALAEQGADVPDEVAAMVSRMMAKQPGDRFASYAELIAAIDEVAQLVDPDAKQPQTMQPRAVVVNAQQMNPEESSGLRDAVAGVGARMSGVFQGVKSGGKQRVIAMAASAVLVLVVVLVAVLVGGGADRMSRIDAGDAQEVLDEIAKMPVGERTGQDELERGHAHAALGQERDAFAAYNKALEEGAMDGRVIEFAVGRLEERGAKAAVELLVALPGDEVTARLNGVVTDEGWWARHQAVDALKQRGEDGDVDQQRLALTDLATGPKCGPRRYGLRNLGEHGSGAEALAAIDAAAARDDNGCMAKDIEKVRRAVSGR